MPWCPIERTEYREGFTVCADCGATLVPNEPPSPPGPEPIEGEFVGATSLGTYDRIEIALIADLLKEHGIASVVTSRLRLAYTRSFYPGIAELVVPSDKADQARRIIATDLPKLVSEVQARAGADPDFSDQASRKNASHGTLVYFGWLEPEVAKVFLEVCAQNGIACEPEYPLDAPPPPYAREDGRVLMHVDPDFEEQAAELLDTKVRDSLPHRWIQFNEPLRGEDL